jgi:hypothetical protein
MLPPGPSVARTLAAVLASVGLALPALASASPRSTDTQKALAFSRCMRAHGIARFPDPGSGGTLPKETPQQLGVGSSQYQHADAACRHLLPNGGGGQTQAQLRQLIARELKVAACMRAHGDSGFPDPDSDGHFPDAALHRAERSPTFHTANKACLHLW